MKPGSQRERVRCRLIADDDLVGVAALLDDGFPGHAKGKWAAGLERMRRRDVPEGLPRYGHCLEAGGKIVGVILLIASMRRVNGEDAPFINVASWYVVEDYRTYAQLLVSIALRNKLATYTNVTPAPQTWSIVENQGYTRYCDGFFLASAILKRPARGVTVASFGEMCSEPAVQSMPEYEMLRRHQALGCTVLIVREDRALSGYVLRRFRIRKGRIALPAMLVVHGPNREQLVRIAGNLGRYLLRHAAPMLVMDANGPVHGLTGYFTDKRGRKYVRGPHVPALCDLADSEFAIFGV